MPFHIGPTSEALSPSLSFAGRVERGKRVRMCTSLLIRDDRDGRMKEIARYDDHLGFRRHVPGSPPGRREDIPLPPGGDAIVAAKLDLLAMAFPSKGEPWGIYVGGASRNMCRGVYC